MRKTIVFGLSDSEKLSELKNACEKAGWPHVNRSTLVRAMLRLMDEGYNDFAYPANALGNFLHAMMPALMKAIDTENRRWKIEILDKKAYETRTIIFGREDGKIVTRLIRVGVFHHWTNVNQSNLIRALIQVMYIELSPERTSISEIGKLLAVEIPKALEAIDQTSKRPGVNPIRSPDLD